MAKIPKVKYVKSKSLNKKINEVVNSPSSLRGRPLSEVNQILSALQGNPSFQNLYGSLNPTEKQYVDANIGNPKPRKAGLFRSEQPYFENISNKTPQQSQVMYDFLRQAMPESFLPKDATSEQISAAQNQGLSGTLSALDKPYESPLNTQLNSMFGHMANPVLQNFLNPSMGQNARVMFPSQMENQMSPGIEGLLSQLASSGISQGIQGLPGAYQYAQENGPAVYQYAKSLPGQAYNYARESGPVQSIGNKAQDLYGFAKTLPGEAYGDISSLLSSLGNRFRGNQQPQQ